MTRVAAILLAAGRSTRYGAMSGGANKLTADFGGMPLVRTCALAALASRARPVVVVLGHEAEALRQALAGLDLGFVENPTFASGMASSLRAGIAALPADVDASLVLLGDMPLVGATAIDRVISAFADAPQAAAIVPLVSGEWAHPVLLARALFAEIDGLAGDAGARALLQARCDVVTLELGEPGLTLDADTPQALAVARAFISARRSSP